MKYLINEKTGEVHTERVAAFLQEVAELQRKYGFDLNAGHDSLQVDVRDNTEWDDQALLSATDNTGTKEERDERRRVMLSEVTRRAIARKAAEGS